MIDNIVNKLININRCLNVYVEQGSETWKFLRKGRITSTAIGKITKFAKTEDEKWKLARIIIGVEEEEFTDEAKERMKIGVEYEDCIRKVYSEQINMKVHQTGICIFKSNPILSCSPDGIFEDGTILEIKTTEKPTPEYQCQDFSEIPIWYYYQIQCAMFILDSPFCHFISYSRTSEKLYCRIVPYNHERFINECYIPICEYHRDYVMPVLKHYQISDPYVLFAALCEKFEKIEKEENKKLEK